MDRDVDIALLPFEISDIQRNKILGKQDRPKRHILKFYKYQYNKGCGAGNTP